MTTAAIIIIVWLGIGVVCGIFNRNLPSAEEVVENWKKNIENR